MKKIIVVFHDDTQVSYDIPDGWETQVPDSGFFAVQGSSGARCWINTHYIVSYLIEDVIDKSGTRIKQTIIGGTNNAQSIS